MIGLSRHVVERHLLPPVLLLLLVLSPCVHSVLHSIHPLSVLLHLVHNLLSLLFFLSITPLHDTHSLLPASIIQRKVLLRLSLSLLVLREHTHDLLLDRRLLLLLILHPHDYLGQRVGVHSLLYQVLVVFDHALRRALDQPNALLLLLGVLRLIAAHNTHLQQLVRTADRLERFAGAGVGTLVGVNHVRQLQIALADVLVRGGLGQHENAERVQVLPLWVRRKTRCDECILAREALDVLDR